MRPCTRWLLSLTLTAFVLAVWPGRAQAHPLDPTSFTSLGPIPQTPPTHPRSSALLVMRLALADCSDEHGHIPGKKGQ